MSTYLNIIQMVSIYIKPCLTSDFDRWLQIAHQSYNSTYDFVWEDGGALYVQQNFNREILEEAHKQGAYIGFCMVDEKELGVLLLRKNQAREGQENGNGHLYLDKIYLLAEAQGKGVGTWCMNWIENYAHQHQQRLIWLTSMDFSPSFHFYQKLGYYSAEKVELDKPYMRLNYRTMHFMQKDLPSVALIP